MNSKGFDRGLAIIGVRALAKMKRITYEEAHAYVTEWGSRNPHPDTLRVPRFEKPAQMNAADPSRRMPY